MKLFPIMLRGAPQAALADRVEGSSRRPASGPTWCVANPFRGSGHRGPIDVRWRDLMPMQAWACARVDTVAPGVTVTPDVAMRS